MTTEVNVARGIMEDLLKLLGCVLTCALAIGGFYWATTERGTKDSYVSAHSKPGPKGVYGIDRATWTKQATKQAEKTWTELPTIYTVFGGFVGLTISAYLMMRKKRRL